MRNIIFRFLIVAFLVCVFSAGDLWADTERLPVFVYHHIQTTTTSDVSCTPEQFESQMKALLKAGYTPLNLVQTRLFIAGALKDISKPVLITFDDGYDSLYDYALPVAEKLAIPMTVFLITARIGRKIQFADYLTDAHIRRMVQSGLFDFGSHTHDLHTDTIKIFNAFGAVRFNPVATLLQRDLRISAARLESLIGKRPTAIAWPYGKFNPDTTFAARCNGFTLHFTSINGYNEPGTNPFSIKRIPVTSRDTVASVLNKASGDLYKRTIQ